MTPIEIGMLSVVAIVVLVYLGVYIPIALGLVSFVSIILMRDNFDLSINLLKIAIGDSVMEYTFATVPLFTFMGLIVSKAGLGRRHLYGHEFWIPQGKRRYRHGDRRRECGVRGGYRDPRSRLPPCSPKCPCRRCWPSTTIRASPLVWSPVRPFSA